MDEEVLQNRIDYFHDLGYISYTSETKKHPLLKTTLLLVIKIWAMYHNLSFPRITGATGRGIDVPELYTTELGDKIFTKYLESMSTELFEMVAPIYKNTFTPQNFVHSNPRTIQNLRGEVGITTRKKPKMPITIHLLVDNDEPFEYLKSEYIWDNIYEARTFVNKLVAYIPPSKLELWRVRTDVKTGAVRKDALNVLTTKSPYNMR